MTTRQIRVASGLAPHCPDCLLKVKTDRLFQEVVCWKSICKFSTPGFHQVKPRSYISDYIPSTKQTLPLCLNHWSSLSIPGVWDREQTAKLSVLMHGVQRKFISSLVTNVSNSTGRFLYLLGYVLRT